MSSPDEHVVQDGDLPNGGTALAERDPLTRVQPPALRAGPVSPAMQLLDEQLRFAQIFATSTEFKTSGPPAVAAAKAAIKIIAGGEFGLSPMQSMRGIYVFDGNVAMAGPLLLAIVDRSKTHRYRIIERTMAKAVIRWYVKTDDPLPDEEVSATGWVIKGDSEFTVEQAMRAGLVGIGGELFDESGRVQGPKDNWRLYLEAMLLWRCASTGAKLYAQSLFFGPVHLPEELNAAAITDETGRVIGADAVAPIAASDGIPVDSPYRAQIEALLAQFRPVPTRAKVQIMLDSVGGDEERFVDLLVDELEANRASRGRAAPVKEPVRNGAAPPEPPASKPAATSPEPAGEPAQDAPPPRAALDTRVGSMRPHQRAALFATLNELGIKAKPARLDWAAHNGAPVDSFTKLSEKQADALVAAANAQRKGKAYEQGLREVVMDSFCATCRRPHGEEHADGCAADRSQPDHYVDVNEPE